MSNIFLSEKFILLYSLHPVFFLSSLYLLYGQKYFTQEIKFGKISKKNLSKPLYYITFILIIIFISYKYEEILSSDLVLIVLWALSVLGILRQWDKDNNDLENDIKKLEEFNKSK